MVEEEILQFPDADIEVEVVRKNIKNINLRICPPAGKVRASIPETLKIHVLDSFIRSKMAWIKEKQIEVQSKAFKIEPEKCYVSGEMHTLGGQVYRLNIVFIKRGKQQVKVTGADTIEMHIRPNTRMESRQRLMHEFYRGFLQGKIPAYIAKWVPIMGVNVKEWRVKRMKTKWGTCNIRDKRIWINLELAKKKTDYLEYIIVHEMTHLLEKYHNDDFKAHMDSFIPHWRRLKDELNKS